MTDNSTAKRRGQWLIVALGLLFIGPLAVAWMLYFSGHWAPSQTSNNGELISPPRPLPEAALQLANGASTPAGFPHGAWTLYLRDADGCGEGCRERLYLMRQTHKALGKEAERVRRVLLVEGVAPDAQWLATEHPELLVVPVRTGPAADLVSRFPSGTPGTGSDIFLSDPLGNLMMYYPPGGDERDMLDDLKKLLKLSRIG